MNDPGLITALLDPSSPEFRPDVEKGRFGIAFAVAAIVELALIPGLLILSHHLTIGMQAKKSAVVHIHAVTLPPPPKPLPQKPVVKPKPKPPPPKPVPPKPAAKPMPKPPPKPLPKPKPRPRPKPIPKPRPRPLPREVKPRVRPKPHIVRRPIIKPQPLPLARAAPKPSPAEIENALAAYLARLRARVQADLSVPTQIRMLGISGTAKILIRLAPDGQLLGATILQSSGAVSIDSLALKTVRETIFPPFTAKMPRHPLTFSLAVQILH